MKESQTHLAADKMHAKLQVNTKKSWIGDH